MGLFDRYEVGDCGMLATDSGPRGFRSPQEAEYYHEIYQREKGLLYGMTDKELAEYLIPRRGQIIDPYYGDEDTLH